MTLNERKALNAKIKNGGRLTFQDAMNVFFLPEDQDAFARQQGWQDAAQMFYYENLAMQAQAQESEQLPPPPAEIFVPHEMMQVDSREVYTDDESCPLDGDFLSPDWQNLAGVY